MIKTLPDQLLPGSTLPHVEATVIAARRLEHPQDRYVVLALRVDIPERAEYVVWEASILTSETESDSVHLYWGHYYPAEYIESLARATATYHHKIGVESFALLADEIRDMGVEA